MAPWQPKELGARLTEYFLNSVITRLHTQAEGTRQAAQQLVGQQQRAQEVTQELTQASTDTYLNLLDSIFSFYQGGTSRAKKRSEEAERRVEEAESGRSEAESQGGDGLPLADYDSLNIGQISERLHELSVEEIKRLRDYEVRNKDRRTLVRRLNSRIEASS